MICISIGEYGFSACRKAVKKCESIKGRFKNEIVAEIRLDLCGLSQDDVVELFTTAKIPLLATLRKNEKNLLRSAIEMGASYIDLDIYTETEVIREFIDLAHLRGTKVILSFHDFKGTPKEEKLKSLYQKAQDFGADIFKIATTANSLAEAEKTLSLYSEIRKKKDSKIPISAFSIGDVASYSRIESFFSNAPLVYCAYNLKNKTAEGQILLKRLDDLTDIPFIKGNVVVPSSKSIAQRAIIAASLAKGESDIRGLSYCKDTLSAINVAKQLGSSVVQQDDMVSISSLGLSSKKVKKDDMIDNPLTSFSNFSQINIFVGESGLLSRLTMPIAAQIKEKVIISGEGTLMARPMFGSKEALEELGASCILSESETLPAAIQGPLKGKEITISGKKGSQLISGLLMALPLSTKDSTLLVTDATSVNYLLITLQVIKEFGIDISYTRDVNNFSFDIKGKQSYYPKDLTIEGDWSAAANFIVAAAIFGEITIKGLNQKSMQGDRVILDIVKQCGAIVSSTKAGLTIKRSHLTSFHYFDATDTPDLFPILVVLAAFCEGETRIAGMERLVNKESNRGKALISEFTKAGVDIKQDGNEMVVNGISLGRRLLTKKMLKGGNYKTFADHRIAMALRIALIATRDKVTLDDASCINKSYKEFEDTYKSILFNK